MSKHATVIVFDLDGTITRRDTYLPFLFGLLLRKPWIIYRLIGLPFAVVMHLAGMRNNTWLKKVFLKAFLKGMTEQQINIWVDSFADKVINNGLRDGAVAELNKHIQAGSCVLLVSASLDIYVNCIGEKLGVHATLCTEVEFDDYGCITGDLKTENCYGQEKISRLECWLQQHGAKSVDIAYSDHHSDIPLLNFADIGVAVSPSKKLSEFIQVNELKLVHW